MKHLLRLIISLVLFISLPSLSFASVQVNSLNFPDSNFRTYISSNFDTNNDGILSDAEIASVTRMDVSSSGIASLKGIEYFSALTYLDCMDNNLKELDISNNTALTYLSCWINEIEELDVSNNTALRQLDCCTNKISHLDVSKNTELTYLCCIYRRTNNLFELDLSNNVNLYSIYSIEDVHGRGGLKVYSSENNNNYPYQVNMSEYLSLVGRIININGYDIFDNIISSDYSPDDGTLRLAAEPVRVYYEFDTGRRDFTLKINLSSGSGAFNERFSWNGHTYQVFSENLTWEQAKAKCETLGGHLATITSQPEQEFIESVIRNADIDYKSCWLGAKADDYGIWSWVTNEVFERQYSNFASNQPDGSGSYLQIFVSNSSASSFSYSLGQWDDTNLYGINSGEISKHGFICEWEEEPAEVKVSPLARDFVQWLENPEDWRNSGTLPDPEDTSHLINNPPKNNSVRASANEFLPVSYDARTTTGLPPARDQGKYNTCWAFASLGAMEADYLAQKMTSLGTIPDLSELHLAWKVYDRQRKVYVDDCVLNQGGKPGRAIAFLKQNDISPVNEKNMSYDIAGTVKEDSDGKIEAFLSTSPDLPKAPLNLKDGLIVEGDNIVSYDRNSSYNDDKIITDSMSEESRNRVKTLIMEHGAVFFCYFIDDNGYNSEHNAFYSNSGNEYHAALIVGWDDNFSRENFNESSRPDENGAWLIRNSRRGEYDGVNGYFWMSYQQVMQRLRLFTVIEEKIDTPEPKPDPELRTINISYPWAAKIFKAESDENLTAVDFYTTDNNAQYKVYAKNLGKNKPQNPGDTEYVSLEGELSYTGMHGYMELQEPIELYSGDYYSIIIRMILPSDYEYPTGVSSKINGYYTPEVKAGENFFAENKEGEDVPSYWYDGLSMDKGPFASTINALRVPRAKVDDEPVGTKPSLTTSSLPEANVGDEYNFTLSASGTGNIEYFCGNVPLGLKLSKEGVLSGIPKDGGEYTLHLTLRNKIDDVKANLAMKINGDPYIPDNDEENNNDTDNDQDNRNKNFSGGSGGGCNTGACVLSFVLVLAALTKRK